MRETPVTWTFADAATAHNVVDDNGSWRSPTQGHGTFAHIFPEPDSYSYRCTLHFGANGRVDVVGPS